jgi:hypothetical protein
LTKVLPKNKKQSRPTLLDCPLSSQAATISIATAGQRNQRLHMNIPKVLVRSQLLATDEFPLSFTMMVLEQQAAGAVTGCACFNMLGVLWQA